MTVERLGNGVAPSPASRSHCAGELNATRRRRARSSLTFSALLIASTPTAACRRETSGDRGNIRALSDEHSIHRSDPSVHLGERLLTLAAAGSCARVRADASVRCWGRGGGFEFDAPTALPRIERVSQVALGRGHACVLHLDHAVECWGLNDKSQLGVAPSVYEWRFPAPVRGLADVAELSLSMSTSCARFRDGDAACWGDDAYGQLGDGRIGPVEAKPFHIVGLGTVAQIALGKSHACARAVGSDGRDDRGGVVHCWGDNAAGELGDGTTIAGSLPVLVDGIRAVELAVGDDHTCARTQDGAVLCWGSDASGQLGDGAIAPSKPTPQPVAGITDAIELAIGDDHSCALLAGGSVRCWGGNDQGQLGDGTIGGSRALAVTPLGVERAIEIAAGGAHTCARIEERAALCWGRNAEGQIAASLGTAPISTPVRVEW